MKKFSIILNIVLVLVSLFFVVYANIQAKLANEQTVESNKLRNQVVELSRKAELETANARKAEANTVMALEELRKCQESN